jgi:16S rRNA (cytosine967-C5)-methyltransferase
MATAARALALEVLLDVERGGTTLGDLLASPRIEALPRRERGLLHELVLGTLRTRGAIDHSLQTFLERPLNRLERRVRAALRLGAYQILSTRVPARAAVSESVDLVGGSRGRGLVNAVLRRLARTGPVAEPDRVAHPLGWLVTRGSLPRWLAQSWLERLGPRVAVARAEALLEPAPSVVRLNPRVPDAADRLRDAGLQWQELPVPGALLIRGGRTHEAARAGTVFPQALGSQLAAHLAAAPGRVLDACAAPGGKSMLVADLLGDQVTVIAQEASPRRLATLARLTRSWGCPNVRCLGGDAGRPPFGTSFDSVLLDAPCTGLGTLSSNPDLRWRLTADEVRRQAERQATLLAASAALVRSGGRLVYATCSTEPAENEQVVDAFLRQHRDFLPCELPAWSLGFAEGPYLRVLPEREGGDGFFVSVLRRA